MKAYVAIGLLAASLTAQAQTPGQATAHAPDGGVKETLQSISIPPLTSAPFSATVTTEWTKILPDGTTATQKNHRIVARDSSGRIFQERRYFSPNGDKQPTPLSNLQYIDPNLHEYYDCIPQEKTCYLRPWPGSALSAMSAGMTGLRACACATPQRAGMSVENQALGQETVEGITVTVSREVTTIAAGQIGNKKPEPIVKEFWYSPQLGVNLVTKRFDPRSGIQNFVVSQVSLYEPDRKLFEPPADYQIVRTEVVRPGVAQAKP
jgi:hypothetical protein